MASRKYIITVQKAPTEMAIIAKNLDQAIERAKDKASFYDFSVSDAYDFVEGHIATKEEIEEYNFEY